MKLERTSTPVLARLDRRSHQEGDCFIWTGAKGGGGYGSIRYGGRTRATHIAAYETMVGTIPEGLELDHLCRNRACWNPWHMDPVPRGVNIARSYPFRAEKVKCLHGHPWSGDNIMTTKQGHRCRECHRIRARRAAV